ncbi:MAG: hypothetical protein ACP6IS_00330 [Candidatus Asgardarchaeia archaeon]
MLDDETKKELLSMEDVTLTHRKLAMNAIEDDNLLNDIFALLDEKDFRYQWSALKILDLVSLKRADKLAPAVGKIFDLLMNAKLSIIKNSAFIVLLKISKYSPEIVTNYADKMFDFLDSKNVHYRHDAIVFLNNVSKVKKELKEKFLERLKDMKNKEENPVVLQRIEEILKEN